MKKNLTRSLIREKATPSFFHHSHKYLFIGFLISVDVLLHFLLTLLLIVTNYFLGVGQVTNITCVNDT